MKASGRKVDLLALFPSFESAAFGGVQASGREAWKSISKHASESDHELRAEAFYYQADAPKIQTVLRAASRRAQAATVLVWHSGLWH